MVISARRFDTGTGGWESFFFHSDVQGNVRELRKSDSSLEQSYSYTAFGEQLDVLQHYGGQALAQDTNIHYGGQEVPGVPAVEPQYGGQVSEGSISDKNAYRFEGLYGYYTDSPDRTYVRARHYAPQQGRWISNDPLGFDAGDQNLYRYVANNPINKIDPSGLAAVAICYRPISFSGRELPVNHTFIIVAETNAGPDVGKMWYVRGGHPERKDKRKMCTECDNGQWGPIRMYYGQYRDKTPDWIPQLPKQPNYNQVKAVGHCDEFIRDNSSARAYMRKLKAAADSISRQCIPYNPAWRNSNSAARGTLLRAGLPVPRTSRQAPGWGVDLNRPEPPPPWDFRDMIPIMP